MDVNLGADVKGYGAPVVPAVVTEDRERPQVSPIKESVKQEKAALGQKELHRNKPGTQQLSEEEISQAVDDIHERLNAMGSSLKFGLHVDEKSESIVIQLKDPSSGEMVRQFPPEELLELQSKLDDLVGLLYDAKA